MTPMLTHRVTVRALIGCLRGMCTDEAPWSEIDRKLVELDELVCQMVRPVTKDEMCEVREKVVTDLYSENARLRAALSTIAAGKRPDGTYNRGREACEQIARRALEGRE